MKLPLKNIKLLKYPFGAIYQNFGEHPELYGRLGYRGHTGADIATFHGDTVLAAHDGTVVKADFNEIGGNVVHLLSKPKNGRAILTAYGHLEDMNVIVGDEIKAGDRVGHEGNTGFVISGSTPYWNTAPAGIGTHLHFGVFPLIKSPTGWLSDNDFYNFEFPDNGFKGAVNPLDYYQDELEAEAMWVIQLAKDVISRVAIYLKNR